MTYAYACDAGHEFEAEQSIKDAPLESCTFPVVCEDTDEARAFPETVECGSRCRRLILATSFVLRGNGWYKDGYR
jgi:predicted nucleic acid-binding Zn ribbon protein